MPNRYFPASNLTNKIVKLKKNILDFIHLRKIFLPIQLFDFVKFDGIQRYLGQHQNLIYEESDSIS